MEVLDVEEVRSGSSQSPGNREQVPLPPQSSAQTCVRPFDDRHLGALEHCLEIQDLNQAENKPVWVDPEREIQAPGAHKEWVKSQRGRPSLDPEPTRRSHLLGRYSFAIPEAVVRGELRPVHNPAELLLVSHPVFGFEIFFERDILTLFQPVCIVVSSRWWWSYPC